MKVVEVFSVTELEGVRDTLVKANVEIQDVIQEEGVWWELVGVLAPSLGTEWRLSDSELAKVQLKLESLWKQDEIQNKNRER